MPEKQISAFHQSEHLAVSSHIAPSVLSISLIAFSTHAFLQVEFANQPDGRQACHLLLPIFQYYDIISIVVQYIKSTIDMPGFNV